MLVVAGVGSAVGAAGLSTLLQELDHSGGAAIDGTLSKGAVVDRGEHLGVEGPAAAGHLQVHARNDPRPTVVGRTPVGHDETLEAPLVTKDRGEQLDVIRGVGPVDPVVGAHHRPRLGLGDGDLERAQVQLAQRPLVDHGVDHQSMALLVVDRVVLQAGTDALGLDAPDPTSGQATAQQRVLRQVLEGPTACRVALQVHTGTQDDRHPECERLLADRPTDLVEQIDVPRAAERRCGREARGGLSGGQTQVIRVVHLTAQTVRPVGDDDAGDLRLRHRVQGPEAVAAQQLDLGPQVQVRHDVLGARRRRGARAVGRLSRDSLG